MDIDFYEIMDMPDANIPVKIVHIELDTKGNIFLPHWHEHGEFLFFRKGSAFAGCGNRSYSAGPMDIIYVNSCELHSLSSESGKLEYFAVICDLKRLIEKPTVESDDLISSLINSNRVVFQNVLSKNENIVRSLDSVIQLCESRPTGYELQIRSLMLSCYFIMVNSFVSTVLNENESLIRKTRFRKMEQLFQYIEVNYNNPISTVDCAKMLDFSLAHFCHIFRNATGKSFLQYLNEHRIYKSMTLLKETDLSITQISSACGFDDSGYYSRCFRKVTGISPSAVRGR